MPMLQIQRAVFQFGRFLELALFIICGLLLCLIFGSVMAGVVIRYVVSIPWPWTEEVARFSLIWFAPLAAAIGVRRGLHFSFQWGVMALSEPVRRALRQVVNLLVIALIALMLQQSFGLIDVMAGQTSMGAEIDMRLPALGLCVGLGALLVMYALEVIDAALGLATGRVLSVKEARDAENAALLDPAAPVVPAPPGGPDVQLIRD